jgi:rRNA maturation protein Nop10
MDPRLKEQYDTFAKKYPHFICSECGYLGEFHELKCDCGDLTLDDQCPVCGSLTMWLTPEEYKAYVIEG